MVSCEASRAHNLATGHNHAKSWGNSILGAEPLMAEPSSSPLESLYVDTLKSA